jgi:DNA polymerase-3 subunit gamma/tau
MSYEPLHHKYRPQIFADLVGQEAIATTLTNAIVNHKIAPAYLFTGSRGTGKTSSARIFAKSLNCLRSETPTPTPCGECEVCRSIARSTALDVIEIDAASNTGVDNIRDLIERAQFAPVQCRYKVYAIDECHMLSTAAFNALLKTLEEPPARVVFVLATTDPQRVLPTIVSRCQRFDYRRIPMEAMVSHLGRIAIKEKIDITKEAITLIGQLSNGGLRDAQSLLDQLSLFSGKITPEKVWDLVGAVGEEDLLILLKSIRTKNLELVLQQCRNLLDRGREPLIILQNLANFYLNLSIAKTSPSRHDLVALTESSWQQLCVEANFWQLDRILQGQQHLKDSEAQIKNTTQPRLWLEITVLGLLNSTSEVTDEIGREIVPTATVKSISKPPQSFSEDKHSIFTSQQPQRELTTSEEKTEISHSENDTTIVSPQLNNEVYLSVQMPDRSDALPAISNEKNSSGIDVPASDRKTQTLSELASDPPSPPEIEFDPQEIWKKVIASVHPPMTQVLLSQKCHLLDFQGHLVRIGIISPQILNMIQSKVPNIEAAFAKVCQRKVKINLELASGDISSTTPAKTSIKKESTNNSNHTQQPSTAIEKNEAIFDRPQETTSTLPEPKIASNIKLDRVSQPVTAIEEKETTIPSIDDRVRKENDSDEENDSLEEIDRAIASLTKSFEGEIVNLSDRYDRYASKNQPIEASLPDRNDDEMEF